jgi:hypothetical protein
MITVAAKVKKFAGTAVMGAVVTAVGFGLGSGTVQAKPSQPDPHPVGSSTHTSFSTQSSVNLQSPFNMPNSFNLQNGLSIQNSLSIPNSGLHNFIQSTDTRIADPLQGLFGVGEATPFDNFTDSFHGLM